MLQCVTVRNSIVTVKNVNEFMPVTDCNRCNGFPIEQPVRAYSLYSSIYIFINYILLYTVTTVTTVTKITNHIIIIENQKVTIEKNLFIW